MPFIAILGCDGSGKSSVISGLKSKFIETENLVLEGHWRPRLFGKYNNNSLSPAYENPHKSTPRGHFSSFLKLLWIGFNWWFEWFRILRRFSKIGYILFDRFHADILVDPVRYRYSSSKQLAQIFSMLMPQPDLVFYLDAPATTLLTRKSEVSRTALEQAREGYLDLCKQHKNHFVLNAAHSLDEVVREAWNIINRHALDQQRKP